ncbi:hypothetical protein M0R45_035724 [Rubus argutus]
MTKVFSFLQVEAVSVVYLQPTNEVLESKFANAKIDQFSIRNVVPSPPNTAYFSGETQYLLQSFLALGVLGAISSIRQMILDANTYSLFANI